jgi:predicted transcriptional regulator
MERRGGLFYFQEEPNLKPKDVANKIGCTSEKVSEWAKDLERYGIMKFSRTPFGSFMFKESEIKILKEYGDLKTVIGNPRDAIDIFKETDVVPEKKEDMEWSVKLNNAIWRRH